MSQSKDLELTEISLPLQKTSLKATKGSDILTDKLDFFRSFVVNGLPRAQGCVDLFRGDGEIADSHPDCVFNRVRYRRRNW